MLNASKRWEIIAEACAAEGLSLFDADLTGTAPNGVLRVYIILPDGSSVQHSHCTALSHRILDHELVEEILPGNVTLEVSSPGINRKLTRKEHFPQAIGERVKISFRNSEGRKQSVIGVLGGVTDSSLSLTLENEVSKKQKGETPASETIEISRDTVVDAKVDFLFK